MKIYISGPMTGKVNLNAEAFFNAEASLQAAGHQPVNPHRIGRELQNLGLLPDNEKDRYNAYLRADISELMKCDEIYMLRGWDESYGARAEFAAARMVEIPVRYEK